MANKRITDVDFIDSLNSNESFFINQNNSIKQIGRDDIIFGVANGGTGATTAEAARTNLDVYSKSEANTLIESIEKEVDALTEEMNAIHTATISATWTGETAPYIQEVVVSGISEEDSPIIDLVLSDDYDTSQLQLEEWGKIYRVVTEDGLIVVYASEPTEIALLVQLKR